MYAQIENVNIMTPDIEIENGTVAAEDGRIIRI